MEVIVYETRNMIILNSSYLGMIVFPRAILISYVRVSASFESVNRGGGVKGGQSLPCYREAEGIVA